MSRPLPRHSFPNTQDQAATSARDALEALGGIPVFELRDFECVGVFPVSVRLTRVTKPRFVAATARQQSDTTTGVSALVTNWTRSNVRGEPGILINAMDGLTAHTKYTVTLLVVGD